MNLNIFKKIGKNIQLRYSINRLEQDLIEVEDVFSQLLKNAESSNNKNFIYLFNILYGCLNNCLVEKNYQFDFPTLYIENLTNSKKIDNFKIMGEINIVKSTKPSILQKIMSQNIYDKEKIELEIWDKNFWVRKSGFTTKTGKINNKEIDFFQTISKVSSIHIKVRKTLKFYHLLNKVLLDSIKEEEIKDLLSITNNKQFNTLLICFSPSQTKFKILDILNKNYALNSIKIENDIQLIKQISKKWEEEHYGKYENAATMIRILNLIPIEQIKDEINKFLFKEELLKDLSQSKEGPVN